MEKPVLTPDFTVEDIHKLREYNYYQTEDIKPQERLYYYNNRGLEVHKKYKNANYKRHKFLSFRQHCPYIDGK